MQWDRLLYLISHKLLDCRLVSVLWLNTIICRCGLRHGGVSSKICLASVCFCAYGRNTLYYDNFTLVYSYLNVVVWCAFIIIITSIDCNLTFVVIEQSYCAFWAVWLVSYVVLMWHTGRLRSWLSTVRLQHSVRRCSSTIDITTLCRQLAYHWQFVIFCHSGLRTVATFCLLFMLHM